MGESNGLAARLREALGEAIAAGQTPGGVVVVGLKDEILALEAVGDRITEAVAGQRQPMEPGTIFDLASVTKPVATATAAMRLVEAGQVDLQTPACQWLPGLDERITPWHLLTHSAGLPAYKNYLNDGGSIPLEDRRSQVTDDLCHLPLVHEPGTGFLYSCLGYILLTSLVERASGDALRALVAREVTGPLGMTNTMFSPVVERREECAATELTADGVLRGVVHDENARYLDGVGGNAGLFSTAGDLSRFMRMVLSGGALDGARVLRQDIVEKMTTPQLKLECGVRGLGWDIDTGYSPVVRGSFPAGSFGHTGYTGTSIWADMASGAYVILLTNRVHFGREREVGPLRRKVAELAWEACR